jgi:hypothetical protein
MQFDKNIGYLMDKIIFGHFKSINTMDIRRKKQIALYNIVAFRGKA